MLALPYHEAQADSLVEDIKMAYRIGPWTFHRQEHLDPETRTRVQHIVSSAIGCFEERCLGGTLAVYSSAGGEMAVIDRMTGAVAWPI